MNTKSAPGMKAMPMETQALILQVAEQLFMEHGYPAVSIGQILFAINMVRPLSIPATYYLFRNALNYPGFVHLACILIGLCCFGLSPK